MLPQGSERRIVLANNGKIDDTSKSYNHKQELVTESSEIRPENTKKSILFERQNFFEVVSLGEIKELRLWLERGVDVNDTDFYGDSALSIACSNGHYDAVELLLNVGACPNRINWYGRAALHCAALSGSVEITLLLLRKGVDVNVQDNSGKTSLHMAVEKNHYEVVEALTAHNASLYVTDWQGNTALHDACSYSQMETVDLLLANKDINVDFINGESFSALQLAVMNGRPSVSKALLSSGVNATQKDYFGATALHMAVRMGDIELVSTLLEVGVSADVSDFGGYTPLHIAINSGYEDLAMVLVYSLTAEGCSRQTTLGWSALDFSKHMGFREITRYIEKKLLSHGLSIHTKKRPFTLLHDTCLSGDVAKIYEVMGKNPNLIDCKDTGGNTPLHCAYAEVVVALLLSGGADPNQVDAYGMTPLHHACQANDLKLVRFLLQYGKNIDLNAQAYNGFTSLHFACYLVDSHQELECDVIRLLIDHGADCTLKSNTGLTPMDLSCKLSNDVAIKLFLELGIEPDEYGMSLIDKLPHIMKSPGVEG